MENDTHFQKSQDSTQSLEQSLVNFRRDVSVKSVDIGRHQWHYYDSGDSGKEALLLLAGGGGTAETMFQYITCFTPHFRVIAPNLPPSIKTLDEAISGLKALLISEQIEHSIVVGVSFGAMLAQLYIRHFQDSVMDMVITHSTIPSKHLAEPLQMQKTLMSLYPGSLLMWISKRAFRTHIAGSSTPAPDSTRQFWQGYFSDVYGKGIRKSHLVSRARLTADYHSENEFNSRDLLNWDGDLLIIESEQDDVISEGDRGSLKAMYSRAYVQTLDAYDHLAPILAGDEISKSIRNFLLKKD